VVRTPDVTGSKRAYLRSVRECYPSLTWHGISLNANATKRRANALNGQYLHIGFIWRGPAKLKELTPIFDLAEDWIMYGGNNWIVYTSRSFLEWNGWIRAVLGPEDSVLILELTDPLIAVGLMPQWVWDWLNKERTIPESTALGLKPLLPPTLR
jgi:hypothetical protein